MQRVFTKYVCLATLWLASMKNWIPFSFPGSALDHSHNRNLTSFVQLIKMVLKQGSEWNGFSVPVPLLFRNDFQKCWEFEFVPFEMQSRSFTPEADERASLRSHIGWYNFNVLLLASQTDEHLTVKVLVFGDVRRNMVLTWPSLSITQNRAHELNAAFL